MFKDLSKGQTFYCRACHFEDRGLPAEMIEHTCGKADNFTDKVLEDSQKEEWGGWKIVSDMLDNPDKTGIYNTSECYQKLYNFVISQKQQARAEMKEKILNLREKFAELEHEQWITWSKSVADIEDISENKLNRWRNFWIPYSQLDEYVKEDDRKWADKIINLIKNL